MAKTPHSQRRGGMDSIPGQGTRSHMLQLKIPHTKTKTQRSQINKIINCINNNSDINDIRKFLTYKGIEIKESAFNRLVEMASERLIRNEISKDIVKIYNMSNDKKLVKSLIDKFNLNMSLSELGKYNSPKVGRVLSTEVTINENEETDLIGLTINNGLISARV